MRTFIVYVAIGAALCLSSTLHAAGPAPSQLQASISALAADPPDPQATLMSARQRVVSALDRLDHFLTTGGVDKAAGWATFLQLADLKSQISSPTPDLVRLQELSHLWYRNQPGLERPIFLAVREELTRFRAAAEYAASQSPGDLYRERVVELSECLARLESSRNEADAQSAAEITAWLENLDADAIPLVSAVRQHYRRPNAFLQVSSRSLNLYGERKVKEERYISDFILGSYARGMAFSHGRVTFGVAPNSNHGVLEIRFDGQINTPSTTAQRGKVTVYSSGLTNIQARKRIIVTDEGIRILPATATGSASLSIDDVNARSRFVERIAWRKANEMRPEARAVAIERGGAEVTAKLDKEVEAQLGGANKLYQDKVLSMLVRMGAKPGYLGFSSDTHRLHIAASQHDSDQLAAATQPPAMPTCDLGGLVHESMVNNIADTLLGGRTIRDEAFHDMMHLLMGNAPRALWVHDREERWSATFSESRPVNVQFGGDRITIRLRVQKIIRGDRVYARPLEVEGVYKPQTTDEGPALLREGPLALRIEGEPQPEADEELKAFATRKFGGLLVPELYFDGVVPPEGGRLGKLRDFKVTAFRSSDSWLTLAYQLKK